MRAGNPHPESLSSVVRWCPPLISAWPTPTPGAPDFGGISEAFNSPLQTIRDALRYRARGSHLFTKRFSQRDLYNRRQCGLHFHQYESVRLGLGQPERAGCEPATDSCFFPEVIEHSPCWIFASRLFLYRRADTWNARGESARLSGWPPDRRDRRSGAARRRIRRPSSASREAITEVICLSLETALRRRISCAAKQ